MKWNLPVYNAVLVSLFVITTLLSCKKLNRSATSSAAGHSASSIPFSKESIPTFKEFLFSGELEYEHALTQFDNENHRQRTLLKFNKRMGSALAGFDRYMLVQTLDDGSWERMFLIASKPVPEYTDLMGIDFKKGGVMDLNQLDSETYHILPNQVSLIIKGKRLGMDEKLSTIVQNFNTTFIGTPLCEEWVLNTRLASGELLTEQPFETCQLIAASKDWRDGDALSSSNPRVDTLKRADCQKLSCDEMLALWKNEVQRTTYMQVRRATIPEYANNSSLNYNYHVFSSLPFQFPSTSRKMEVKKEDYGDVLQSGSLTIVTNSSLDQY